MLALVLPTACGLGNQPVFDGVLVRRAEAYGDSVRIEFTVDVGPADWRWYVDLDTDQALDVTGKKTGYGDLGAEFEIDSRDKLADSVAVRPTSGPVDPSPGARGWPIPVGFAKMEPSKGISLRFPRSMLGDDGILVFQIVILGKTPSGVETFFGSAEDSTHVRPPGPAAMLTSSGARARWVARRRA